MTAYDTSFIKYFTLLITIYETYWGTISLKLALQYFYLTYVNAVEMNVNFVDEKLTTSIKHLFKKKVCFQIT